MREYGNETATLLGPLSGKYGNETATLLGPLCGSMGMRLLHSYALCVGVWE